MFSLDKLSPFMIGVADFAFCKEMLFEKGSSQKVFNPTTKNGEKYLKGCSHIQYGKDLSQFTKESNFEIVMKVSIAKNKVKFMNEDNTSCAVAKEFQPFDQNAKYVLFVVSQNRNFEMKLVSADSR